MYRLRILVALAAFALSASAGAQTLTKISFATNWFAQAEHGGFYQALAEGIYKKHGLDADIRMGGPQVNGMQLLAAGALDLFMGYDIQNLSALEQGVPVMTVAAVFQKDPVVIISHPGVATIEELKGKPIAISSASHTTFWPWLVARFGFNDGQKRPYSFSVQPFLADRALSMQGYVTSEPYSVEKAGVKPVIFLLADYGYPPYAQTVVATRDTVAKRGDAVKRFLRATAEGWKSYLANPAPGNALIRKANPQMEDALIVHGITRMKQYGLVTGGDAAKQGILTMTDARWKQTCDFMKGSNLLKPQTDCRQAYTLDLIKDVRVLP